jgi:hypothetical protein
MDERASVDGVYAVVYQQPGILTTEYQVDAGSPEEAVEIAEDAGLFVADDAWEGEGPKMPAIVSWHGVLKHETDEIWPSWLRGGPPHDWEGQFQQGPQGSD